MDKSPYFLFILFICASLLLWYLFRILKGLIRTQIKVEIEKFAEEAKIPRVLRDQIAVKFEWKLPSILTKLVNMIRLKGD